MSEAGSDGFTLLEALVALAITALIAGIVVPNMVQALDILTLQETTRILQADLRVLRQTAIRTGQKVDLEATNHGHEYDWIGGSRYLPPSITLRMSNPLVVYPDGSMQPATITISSGRRQYPVIVDPVTGAVAVGSQ
jgi:general secretion pathway protein H